MNLNLMNFSQTKLFMHAFCNYRIAKFKYEKTTKYQPLQAYFNQCESSEIKLSIHQIENIIGKTLPNWAFTHQSGFWGNSGEDDHVQKRAWLHEGYNVISYQIDAIAKSF